jgi:hypothetical protein
LSIPHFGFSLEAFCLLGKDLAYRKNVSAIPQSFELTVFRLTIASLEARTQCVSMNCTPLAELALSTIERTSIRFLVYPVEVRLKGCAHWVLTTEV